MPLRETCPLQYFGVSLAGIKIKSKRWSFVSWFFTQRLLFHVMKMLTKENNRKDCLTLYQHKMCSIVLIEAICFQGWRSVVIKQPIFVTWLYFGPSHITQLDSCNTAQNTIASLLCTPLQDFDFNPHKDTVSFKPQDNYCSVDIMTGKEKKTMAWESKL